MATPFDEVGALDLDGATELAARLVEAGNDGLVVTGSTGESTTLTDTERVELWRAVADAVEVPVLAGSTSADTAHSVELTERATAAGVSGILAVTPYYSRPSQAGLDAHFRAVAQATDLPVLLYDIPSRTGRRIAPETILELAADVDNIIGLKDASGDPAGTARLLARAPQDFECYSGDDALTLPLLAVGAVGLIGVATHWCAAECGEMIRDFLAGNVDEALEIGRALLPSFVFETGDDAPNPQPTKAMLRVLGLPAGECRLPLGPAPTGLEDRAKTVIAELDAWRRQRC
jgi:4-hydroxy-tetrahydrodipicolinate synthase